MKKIKLTQGKFALVDNADFKKIALYRWYYNNSYAVRKAPKLGKQIRVYMHRFILNTPDGLITDHKDGNRLNNQRHNLRICTQSQNMSNTELRTDNTTGFKGVTFCKALNKFQAQIKLRSKNKHLGYFKNVKDAAKAYNNAATELFGEFAKFKNPTGK